ncbi:S24 family peptidase [Rhizobium sp.]|uniref:S24 family peptidase n=1 Tax=Rhizobium sp. TaxID=391 RepID=UPI003F7D6746
MLNLPEILKLVDAHHRKTGETPTELSRRATGKKDTIRNWKRRIEAGEEASASFQNVQSVLDAMGIRLARDDEENEPSLRRVFVTAHVQAGQWAETWEWEDEQKYPVLIPDLPEYRTIRLYAAETRGPSMNKRYPERTVIVFNDVQETGEDPMPGKRYVVERRRASGEAEHTVKTLFLDADGKHWLMPESDDPRYQAPISIEEGTEDGDLVVILGRVVFSVTRE